VVTSAFSTEEGAFLRGQITMEDHVQLDLDGQAETPGKEAEIPPDIKPSPSAND
jgi:hypothetical protein